MTDQNTACRTASFRNKESTGEDSGYKGFPSWSLPPVALRRSWESSAVAAMAEGGATWPD